MMIVDVHAHMDFPDYRDDLDEVMRANEEAGVVGIVSQGTTVEANRRVLELAEKYKTIKPALGIYPVHVVDMSDNEFDAEIKFIREQKGRIVAIGEVGLDYLKGDDNPHGDTRKEVMRKRFQRFIDLAKKMDLPIICHSRRAELDVIEMLEKSGHKKVVMHCFMGRKHLVKRIVENGWSLSIPCIIGRLQQLQENVAMAPIGQILTETDAPYMSPFPDTKRNEPRFIAESLKVIAKIKGLDVEETSKLIYLNYQKMFL
ncbi:TatD family hydrolase [Candidatus Woesearchaeota archaeon]|nr:TatD family hydrolase [Candidatus Woesearchaeota archaeon]